MHKKRLALLCFSLFIAFFAHAGDEDIEYSDTSNKYVNRLIGYFYNSSDIFVKFIFNGTFTPRIVTRNSQTGALADYGYFYTNDYWNGYLPVNSRILVAVFSGGYSCYYFNITKPTFGNIEVTGALNVTTYGDGIAFQQLLSTFSIYGCPNP
ncbi:MAG: hypothetical protein KAG53_00660 [Endozoicomonadaceae bacterium]|nr:hypothetical protein [Endozoicomonadaceae bacterium]